ncbi:MAG: tRNA preQ1(34) S-adenosylmethionine ribosyltransferase-isomerase QueA [Thermodesulfovibrionales bacterium]
MKTAEYDFDLPEEAIALRPVKQRDGSRLLVLDRRGGLRHLVFSELPSLLDPGDLLILNDSKVLPAKLIGTKPDGDPFEMILVQELEPGRWRILSKGRYSGPLTLAGRATAQIHRGRTAHFGDAAGLRGLIDRVGLMPLPPYIRRSPDDEDRLRYQTVFARHEGSIAAPTAGLHFTDDLLGRIEGLGVRIRTVTLHVGIGTFRPVKTDRVEDHRMDEESFSLDASLVAEIASVKESGRRVITVGTTATRTIEGLLSGRCRLRTDNGTISGTTDIFIHEGYRFRAVDGMITNFHLPCSTPLMLAAALAGREKLLESYRTAITMGYRFFSYGDAMLVI